MAYYEEPASRGSVHSSADTRGLLCDGKGCFEIIEGGKRIKSTRYWCSAAHQNFDPMDEGWICPRGFSGTGGGKF